MRAVRLVPMAKQDLAKIATFLAEHNPQAALKFIDAIGKSFDRLAAIPGIGHRRSDVADSQYRFWNVKPYVIAYRFDDEVLMIVRIVHGARDFRNLFDNP